MRPVTVARTLVILFVVGSVIQLLAPSILWGAASSSYYGPTPYSATEALLNGYAENVRAYSSGYAENIKAQAMLLQAQAALLKTQYDGMKMRVDMMESYQKARALTMDNDQKAAKNYYDRRQLRDTYKAMQELKRYGNVVQLQQMLGPAAAAKPASAPAASGTSADAPSHASAPAPRGKAAPAKSEAPPAAPPVAGVAAAPPAVPTPAAVQLATYQRPPVAPRAPEPAPRAARGLLLWPAVFNDPVFAEYRARMDALFGARTLADGGPTTEFYHHVYRTASTMATLLQSKAREMSSAESIAARRFLESLVLDASRPPIHLGEVARN